MNLAGSKIGCKICVMRETVLWEKLYNESKYC